MLTEEKLYDNKLMKIEQMLHKKTVRVFYQKVEKVGKSTKFNAN